MIPPFLRHHDRPIQDRHACPGHRNAHTRHRHPFIRRDGRHDSRHDRRHDSRYDSRYDGRYDGRNLIRCRYLSRQALF